MTPEQLGPRLAEEPGDFEFFQATRLIERLSGAAAVGRFAPPATEAARFSAPASLDFPPTQVRSIECEAGPARMTVNFFGLTGPLGILPTHYTELIRERLRAGDTAPQAFFDIFNHRLVSLFFRAWEKYRVGVAYERGQDDRFTHYLLDLIGLGTPGLRNRQDVPDAALIYYAGLVARAPRSGSALEQMLGEYFDAPVEVLPFAGAWRPIEAAARTRFLDGRSDSEALGVGTVIGDEVWDQQSIVRVRFGPLPLARYLELLPDGAAHRPLRALLKFFCGHDLDVEVNLVLKRDETPRCGLGRDEDVPPRLGWVSWMYSRPLGRDPDETVLRLWESEA